MKASASLQRSPVSTTLGVGAVYAPATGMRRFKVYDIILGSDANPADVAVTWQLLRTVTPVGAGVTPAQLDSADVAPVTLAAQVLTANGTTGAILMTVPVNQRATFRWWAAPGQELMMPAVAGAGLDLLTPEVAGTPAPSAWATVLFDEL